ncbi:MAG: GNAT family N-acetyltransferase [Gemmatimonadota bacterium]|jgi:phosphinothricin acetyltransferase
MLEIDVRLLTAADYPRVREIYLAGIATGHATFETEAPDWEGWDRKFLGKCRLVAESDGKILGWAALSPVSDRCVYGGVGEVAVYVAPETRGEGVGTRLLGALVRASEDAGLWTLQAGIFPENAGSIRIHEKCGFRVIGTRERLGKMGNRWRDVLLLERRSDRVGVE